MSNKWGFTNLTRLEYKQKIDAGLVVPDGVNVKVVRTKGPLEKSVLFQSLSKA